MTDPSKHVHFVPDSQPATYTFHGGGNTLTPHHKTRYEYPSPLHYPLGALRLQPPISPSTRTRPQGRGTFGPSGTPFITISPSPLPSPTAAEFTQALAFQSAYEQNPEVGERNPLGRAMARVSLYPGNTVLECGKFKLRGGALVFVVRRRTCVVLQGGGEGREECVYVIGCAEWRGIRVESLPGHDGWWERLWDLFNARTHRAYWCTRDCMDKYKIPVPEVQWRPRPDIDNVVFICRQPPPPGTPGFEDTGGSCPLCSSEWFAETESACLLRCKKHWLCLDCVYELVDEAGRGTMHPDEVDPNVKYWRCPMCRFIIPVSLDRASIIQDEEFQYWKHKIAKHRLTELITNWPTLLYTAEIDGWCPALPPQLDHVLAAGEDIVKARVVHIHLLDAIQLMEAIPIYIAGLLDWGVSLDNPVNTEEADVLKACLIKELEKLATSKRKFHTEELIQHMTEVGKSALKPVVVAEKAARLDNPIYPPGFEDYRQFLCEWTARVCFLSPGGRTEVLQFMERMKRETKKGWWKDVREVWFNRGAPV